MAVYWIFTGPQNAKFKSSKYVFTKKPQYKRAHENLGVYSISLVTKQAQNLELRKRTFENCV